MKISSLFSFFALLAVTYPVLSRGEAIQGLVLPFKEVSVSSPVLQDVVKDIEVDEGDQVKKDQVLAHLLNDREQIDVQRYDNLVKRAEYQYKAMKTLADSHDASQDALIEKETDLQAAKLDYQLAVTALEEKTIKSPLSGIVVKRYKEQGESVDRTEKLFDVVNIDQVYIQFYLNPSFIEKLAVGDKIAVRFPALKQGAKEYQAAVSFIDPRIDAASQLFRVKLLLDNPNHDIKAGMSGEADFSKTASSTTAAAP
jgi:membrane fusion protein (multidrug efflux system)